MLTGSRLKNETDQGVLVRKLESVDIIAVKTKRFSTLDIQQLGRVLIANKDFDVGDLVLRESPLVWFSDSKDLIIKFLCEMTAADKIDMLSMFHFNSPKDTVHQPCQLSMTKLAEEAACMLEDIRLNSGEITANEIFKCLSIVNLNAHSFHPTDGEPNRGALFPAAAIISHSCQPNTIYAIDQNCIEYYATRPIARGEEITSTYLAWGDLVMCNTVQRRHKLIVSKDFICLCTRCKDIDFLRGVPCRCQGLTFPTFLSSKSSASTTSFTTSSTASGVAIESWRCMECNSSKKSVWARVEHDLEEEYRCALLLFDDDNVENKSRLECIHSLESLVEAATLQLSPTHSLVVRMLLSLIDQYVAEAETLASTDYYAAKEFRLLAIQRLELFVRTMECIEARCSRAKICLASQVPVGENEPFTSRMMMIHPPTVLAVKEVLDIWFHSMRCHLAPPDWLPAYIPLLSVFYGEKNSLVRDLKRSFGLGGDEGGDDLTCAQDLGAQSKEFCRQS